MNTPRGRGRPSNEASKRSIAAAAREYGERALDVLVQVMEDEEAPPAARIDAASKLLDRGYGKPVALNATVTNPFDDLDATVLRDLVAALSDSIAGAESGVGRAGTNGSAGKPH